MEDTQGGRGADRQWYLSTPGGKLSNECPKVRNQRVARVLRVHLGADQPASSVIISLTALSPTISVLSIAVSVLSTTAAVQSTAAAVLSTAFVLQ